MFFDSGFDIALQCPKIGKHYAGVNIGRIERQRLLDTFVLALDRAGNVVGKPVTSIHSMRNCQRGPGSCKTRIEFDCTRQQPYRLLVRLTGEKVLLLKSKQVAIISLQTCWRLPTSRIASQIGELTVAIARTLMTFSVTLSSIANRLFADRS
ncbi:hypothetical protein AJ88_46005 [Mesorhizobium amorphae CCBAU 01583]|nr:hypothetical protein AJ88_46005 [Mesorhizobium amorphae CCBAU 01583]